MNRKGAKCAKGGEVCMFERLVVWPFDCFAKGILTNGLLRICGRLIGF